MLTSLSCLLLVIRNLYNELCPETDKNFKNVFIMKKRISTYKVISVNQVKVNKNTI